MSLVTQKLDATSKIMFLVQVALGLGCLLVLYTLSVIGRRDKRLPPGPPTLPIIGNLHQIPTKRTHLKFTEWARTYGEIYSLKIGPSTAVVLTSPRLVKQLVDRKAIYSHRPRSYVGNDVIADHDHLLIMEYSERWRVRRKLLHQFFMEQVVAKQHTPLVNAEAIQMIRDLIVQPEGHMKHPKRYSNSIIMSLVYGSRTPTITTPHMTRLYENMEDWSQVMEPGNAPPVDVFPFLKWVPERLLGMWRSRAETVSTKMNDLYAEWLDKVIHRRRESGSRDCFLDRALDQQEKLGFDRHALYFLCGTLMEGGSDTSSSIIIAFLHAMTKWPEVQKRAQHEIDAVVGEDRTPTWEDYGQLPYVAACVKEAMRWRPVAPLAFPHSLAEDDWVDGMLLPKGSDIFINCFGMQHDEQRFPHHEDFDPDHYKGVTALAPELANGEWELRDHYGYGSGRRLCPGIHLGERMLFLAIAKILWAVHLQAPEGVEPDVSNEAAYSAGFLVCAEPFPCDITARSAKRRETIERELATATIDIFSAYDPSEPAAAL